MAADAERFLFDLRKHETVAADTSVPIYHLEGLEPYVELTAALIAELGAGALRLVVSSITVTELLAGPYRAGSPAKVATARSFVESLPSAEIAPVTLEVADRAARLRAQGLGTPDALVMATALVAKAGALVTNDPAFRRKVKGGPKVLLLDDYLRSR
jgi:predicted nucleic acid-binding protein